MSLTRREKEILELIKRNPMVSQEELANILGLSRSAIAGHIANLMKKGFILGRGYVVKESKGVVVIGGANIDIKGRPFKELIRHTSNPGQVDISLGGVARNIAHNLALLKVPVTLLTVVGNDGEGRKILEETRRAGVNVEHVLISPTRPTGVFLAMLDAKGEMEIGIAQMEVLEECDAKYLEGQRELIRNSELVIMDTNLPTDSMKYVAEICRKENISLLVDPVSIEKARKVREILDKIDYITPNRGELAAILDVSPGEEVPRLAKIIREKGVKTVIVTLGATGVYLASEEGEEFIRPYEAEVIDVTGAGDAFASGLVYGLFNGYTLRLSVKFGLAAAALTISSPYTVNPFLSEERLKSTVKGVI
ncbi:pseudouridine kinase [Thermanaeromonas toyohensis ToBE]|uniref:Pseudouridine kinase n=1 Tax=Thermanaeromonas toyohensis ToBE TaxID=698762 RepID=A0A1W1W0X9_9FIRM|nr:pseudouridine kinase [Thermanaeromonas toyohensis ToBE]